MKRSAQTSQWDNISKRIKRYETNIDVLDAHIAKAEDDISELRTWLSTEFVERRKLKNKMDFYMELPSKDRKFFNGDIRLAQQHISEITRTISHIYANIDEFKAHIQSRITLKNEALRKRDDVLTAYADPKHNEQYDVWPKDDDPKYQPVYLPSGEVADFMDDYNRRHHGYPYPIGPLSNETRAGQYFDNDGNLVLDLNPNPTNQVPYTVDWL
tara:strand:+ start:875 stop:1513 length:639 start_codon:yes stop_codon:yes gene_type:complete